jgi:aminoglycoside phosphotransferase (APT) family kinase protein
MTWQWSRETRERLQGFLAERGVLDRIDAIHPIGDGHSNLTFRVDGAGRSVVVRRPPPPPLIPGSNDVLREAQLLQAVAPYGLPVPRILATGTAGEVLDVPFYAMTLIDGQVISNEMPSAFAQGSNPAVVGNELVLALVHLHAIDWAGAGLASFGRPEGFNRRHIQRIARIVTSSAGVLDARFAPLFEKLDATCPQESGAAIIHNDLRIGNVMWAPGLPPRLAAILDWELATLGDPLFDLAYLLTSLPHDGVCSTPLHDLARACLVPGFPGRDALLDTYRQASGMPAAAVDWFLAAVNWKLAALYDYSHRRGSDPYFADTSQVPRFLAEAALFARAL